MVQPLPAPWVSGDFLQPEDPCRRAGRSQLRCPDARRQQVTSLLNLVYDLQAAGWDMCDACRASQLLPVPLQESPGKAGTPSVTRGALHKDDEWDLNRVEYTGGSKHIALLPGKNR